MEEFYKEVERYINQQIYKHTKHLLSRPIDNTIDDEMKYILRIIEADVNNKFAISLGFKLSLVADIDKYNHKVAVHIDKVENETI